MPMSDLLQILLYLAALLVLTPPVGAWMARVFRPESGSFGLLAPLERGFYRAAGIDPSREQSGWGYAAALLMFNGCGIVLLMALLMLQGVLPLNPQQLPGLSWHLAFNTAVSFVTNTNWQSYGGESTLSYGSQMLGLTMQNFASAGTGIGVLLALTRGLSRHERGTVGNFWVDLTRSILYVLLPLSLITALFLVWQGVPQNFAAYVDASTLDGAHQTLAQGPAASQIAIKQIGTNGGGFFNANSAHPYENPTPLSNFVEMLLILLLPAALVNTYGRLIGKPREAWAIYAAMLLLLVAGLALIDFAELHGNPLLRALDLDAAAGNMEGKEQRFGVVNSAIWADVTTAASNGSVNAMHDSFTPLAGLAAMFNIMLGEIVFGGIGSGLYGMLLYLMITVFIAGLMVGRTPEYLGKKIEVREVRLLVLAMLSMPVGILIAGAVAISLPAGVASIQDAGPHGLSEVLYAYSSATGNNGSAFAGFNANVAFHDVLLALSMLLGRYAYIVPLLIVAGSLAQKKTLPLSAGTFPTHGPLFVGLLIGVVVIVGGLTFVPVLVLGPVAEHFAMLAGHSY